MKVSDCMTRNVKMAGPTQTLQEAARMMFDLDAGVLPVSEGDRLVGMITDRDIAVRGVAQGKGPDARVGDVMSKEVRYCYDDEESEAVLRNMGDIQLRRLPVLNRDKRLIGIVSLADLASVGQTARAGEALGGIVRPGGEHSQSIH
ncbi:MAG: CBS domain-containing protein [Pseudomonadota bacterium]|uniref:CBS domain-containing protein n=1 Tax=unclassified Phenylobacterium TaxID=2640670 RepID=UPI0006FCA961|nr:MULTISPECIES: CBS domain-containing protein [unclassified Phenylobacterium]KRB44658.1 inosine-5-monophosphate dehydrogenase [Phenylobacterium sp. Root700]MBT9472157.1 CBS domain-containing protein [Phenylobacterium sp.]